MIGTIFLFVVAYLVGRAVLKLTKVRTDDFTPSASLVVGSMLLCLLLFFCGFIFPFTAISLTVILLLLTAISTVFLRDTGFHKIIKEFGDWLPWGWPIRYKLLWLFMIALVVWLFSRALFIAPNGAITAGDRLVWTDWPLHIGMAANFAFGRNFPPQNPMFAGIGLIYPFFADFLSGVLLVLGANYPIAFNVPGIVLILAFFHLFLKLTASVFSESKMLKDLKSFILLATGALFMSLFWGGLGFVYWIQEAFANELNLVTTLLTPPREYTFWGEKGMWFFTFLYSEILPQRAFIFGLPIFVLTLLILKIGWNLRVKQNFLFAGCVAGLLPFFHTHTYLSLAFLLMTIGGIGGIGLIRGNKENKKKFLEAVFLFGLPFGVLSLVQFSLFKSQFHGLPVEFGWMKGHENFFVFWFKNTGLFIPLWFLGLWKGKFSRFIKVAGLASLILFILPNIFRFAPWGYDNLKIFTYWYLLGSVFVVTGLVKVWRIRGIGKIGVILLYVSLTLSGVVEVSRIIDTKTKQIGLWSQADQEFATDLRIKTAPDAVFLTAAIHDHPVVALAGRKIVIGFPGNMWSWGIDGWQERETDVHTMYQGGDTAKELWQKYNISYIVVGGREHYFEKNINEEYIKANTQLFLESGEMKVYKIVKT